MRERVDGEKALRDANPPGPLERLRRQRAAYRAESLAQALLRERAAEQKAEEEALSAVERFRLAHPELSRAQAKLMREESE